jgi:hypothetical protein
VPESRWRLHYSLTASKRVLEPLRGQIAELTTWITEKYQFDRPTGAVADATLGNILETLYLFMGFLEHHLGISSPSLLNLLQADQYIQFISFSVAKGRTIGSLTNIISHTKKAYTWLSSSSPELASQIRALNLWVDTVRKQLVQAIPKKKRDVGEMEAAGQWEDASRLVVLVENFVRDIRDWVGRVGGGELAHALARSLHNAALVSCMFSHLPPVRLVCWRTLQVPGSIGCSKKDCSKAACNGNKLYYKEGALHLLLSHYKVEAR